MYNPQLMIDVSRALMNQRLRDAGSRQAVAPVEGRAGPAGRFRNEVGRMLISLGTRLSYGTGTTVPN